MKRKTRKRNIRRTITENYILVVGTPWMGGTASYRYELHGPELASIGKFTRANVRKWLDSHAGDFQHIQDFYATAGDKEIHWATKKGEAAYLDTISGEENPRRRGKRTRGKNPFDLASLTNAIGVKPLTVKLQKVAGQIQMSIEKPTKELLRKLGLGSSRNPSGHDLIIRSLRNECILTCSKGDWSLVIPRTCTEAEAHGRFASHLKKLGLGSSHNPSGHTLVIRSLRGECILVCSRGDWTSVSPDTCTEEEAYRKFSSHLRKVGG